METFVDNGTKKIAYLKNSGLLVFGKAIVIYLIHLLVIHFIFWASFNTYSLLCVPKGVSGFFASLLYHGSFVCSIVFEILNFSKAGVYSMITHLLSGIGTAQWLNYTRNKNKIHVS